MRDCPDRTQARAFAAGEHQGKHSCHIVHGPSDPVRRADGQRRRLRFVAVALRQTYAGGADATMTATLRLRTDVISNSACVDCRKVMSASGSGSDRTSLLLSMKGFPDLLHGGAR